MSLTLFGPEINEAPQLIREKPMLGISAVEGSSGQLSLRLQHSSHGKSVTASSGDVLLRNKRVVPRLGPWTTDHLAKGDLGTTGSSFSLRFFG